MAVLRTAPETVDLIGYGGDTLTIQVQAPTAFIDGRVWSAQVRDTTTDATAAASFTVTEPTEVDGPAFVVLASEDTARLTAGVAQYVGLWDVQVAPAGGGDPVTTLARGKITLTGDVTRLP